MKRGSGVGGLLDLMASEPLVERVAERAAEAALMPASVLVAARVGPAASGPLWLSSRHDGRRPGNRCSCTAADTHDAFSALRPKSSSQARPSRLVNPRGRFRVNLRSRIA